MPAASISSLIADPTLPLPGTMGKRMRAQVEALREAYRVVMSSKAVGVKCATPEAIAGFMSPLVAGHSVESLWMVPLNAQSVCTGEPVRVSQGGTCGTDADQAVYLRAALMAGASSFALVHNHPTGDPTPSTADVQATIRAVSGGRAINVPCVDHVVIGDGGRFASIRRQRPEAFA